jgi:tRNA(Ile)-lysidine synthase
MAIRARSLQPPRALLARVRRYVLDRDLIAPNSRVLVGVSGGPDSTALLLLLASLRRSLGFQLAGAHFDHGLRGARPAERERNAVRELCKQLDVPFSSGAGDVRTHARRGRLSIEEAARELRYRFLARAARAAHCDAVATGHTRNDQAETVLMRLLRGTGLRGLAAMAPSSAWPVRTRGAAPRLLRPLLCLSCHETETVCRAAGIKPLRDPSNRSQSHLRNRLRRDLLPHLRRYNPRVEEALSRLAETAAGDIELLESLAATGVAGPATDGVVRIDRKALIALPGALRAHVVRLAVGQLQGDTSGLSEQHIRAVFRSATGRPGTKLNLARGLSARTERGVIAFSINAAAPKPLPPRPVDLPVPGAARLGAWRIEAEMVRRPADLRQANGHLAYLDAGAVGQLLVRRRRHGDRFQPLGLAGTKKLQDFLVDAHVPRAERDSLPLVCDGQRIAWIVGHRPAEWAKVKPDSRSVVRLRAERQDA